MTPVGLASRGNSFHLRHRALVPLLDLNGWLKRLSDGHASGDPRRDLVPAWYSPESAYALPESYVEGEKGD